MKNKDYYEEKLDESAEVSIDVIEVHQARLKQLGKMFKFGFGRKEAEFKLLMKVMNDMDKFRKLLNDFIIVTKYYAYMGNGSRIIDYLKEAGIKITEIEDTNPINEEKVKEKKFKAACGDENFKVCETFLADILSKGMEQQDVIDNMREEVTVNAELVEGKCDVDKAIFKKSVSLKTQKLTGKDIGDKVKKIENQADQFSQVVELI